MKVYIGEGATADEASAIASALSTHLGTNISVYIGEDSEPAATGEPEYPFVDDLGPTDREAAIRAEIEDILQGGPQKYKDRLPEQGKLFVRDRLKLWFGDEAPDSRLRFEDGTFAAFDEWHPESPAVDADDEDGKESDEEESVDTRIASPPMG